MRVEVHAEPNVFANRSSRGIMHSGIRITISMRTSTFVIPGMSTRRHKAIEISITKRVYQMIVLMV